jgi:hypothetical protein
MSDIHNSFVNGGAEPWGLWRMIFKYKGEIDVRNGLLEAHEGWQRFLFYNGKWLGEN